MPRIHRPDDDEDEDSAGIPKISSFFAPKSEDPDKKRHKFFTERELASVSNF